MQPTQNWSSESCRWPMARFRRADQTGEFLRAVMEPIGHGRPAAVRVPIVSVVITVVSIIVTSAPCTLLSKVVWSRSAPVKDPIRLETPASNGFGPIGHPGLGRASRQTPPRYHFLVHGRNTLGQRIRILGKGDKSRMGHLPAQKSIPPRPFRDRS